jgi:hypothetical protein
MNLSQPMPYTSRIASMNTAPKHHSSYYTNRCTYNYFIITINLFHNNTQMNKILCSDYFTADIICHTPPDILINTSPQPGLTSFIPLCIPCSHPHTYICQYINYTFIAFSVALLIINLTQS